MDVKVKDIIGDNSGYRLKIITIVHLNFLY